MKRRHRLFLVILGLVLPVVLACGKKGPPFLPERVIPYRVQELTAELKNGTVFLRGRVAGLEAQEKDRSRITGCRIYHAWYAMEKSPCDECPVDYSDVLEIEDEVVRGEDFSCEAAVKKKKGVHFFEVRLTGKDEAVGPPSNRTKLIIP